MEASIRFFNPSNINHQFSNSIINRHSFRISAKFSSTFSNASRIPKTLLSTAALVPENQRNIVSKARIISTSCVVSSSFLIPLRNSYPFAFPFSIFAYSIINDRVAEKNFDGGVFDQKEKSFSWSRVSGEKNDGDAGIFGKRGPVVTVVLFGWLGAEEKHLNKYAQLYASRGVHSIKFVVPVREFLGFDLGTRVKKRILELAHELVLWLSESEEDGRERCLIFHTFSNTGWLAYGAILDHLQCRSDLVDKIKGCVVDSGGDPELNPQVWAAGFCAALLKKRSSSTYPLVDAAEGNRSESDMSLSKMEEKQSTLTETMLLLALTKFFSVFLMLSDINRSLTKVISILSNNQPPCPQLYLYSTADKIIPFRSVESFIEYQKKMGKKVWAYNFVSSPHVDHYRNFPHIYSEEINNFLKECIPTVIRK